MPKDYHSITIGDTTLDEVKAGYIYRDGEVRRNNYNGEEGMLMKKYYTPSKGYYWNLKNMRIYEDWAKENLT